MKTREKVRTLLRGEYKCLIESDRAINDIVEDLGSDRRFFELTGLNYNNPDFPLLMNEVIFCRKEYYQAQRN